MTYQRYEESASVSNLLKNKGKWDKRVTALLIPTTVRKNNPNTRRSLSMKKAGCQHMDNEITRSEKRSDRAGNACKGSRLEG